jgi:hypothetical protein
MWTFPARRTLRSQQFVRFTELDKRRREEKAAAALLALQPKPKQISTAEADAFYTRLLADGERRTRNRCTLSSCCPLRLYRALTCAEVCAEARSPACQDVLRSLLLAPRSTCFPSHGAVYVALSGSPMYPLAKTGASCVKAALGTQGGAAAEGLGGRGQEKAGGSGPSEEDTLNRH